MADMQEGGFRKSGPFLIVARPNDTLRRVLELVKPPPGVS